MNAASTGTAPAARVCANCGAPLAGPYCSACGQRHHQLPVHHFGHFLSEATEDLTHADSRLWQTVIALLFRPGFLTREFLEGRRMRYLPPVRLYLVVSVIFFIIVGLNARITGVQVKIQYQGNSFRRYGVIPAPKAQKLAALAHTPARALGGVTRGLTAAGSASAARQRACEQSGAFIEQHAGWLRGLGPRVARNCLAAAGAGGLERLQQAYIHNLERAMFVLLPLLALAMKPLYFTPPRHYVEHLLFLLHNQAFLFVVLGLSTLAQMMTSSSLMLDPISTAIAIYVPVYFYRAMRRVYGQGRWLTLGKLAALGVDYAVLGILTLVATASLSFLML